MRRGRASRLLLLSAGPRNESVRSPCLTRIVCGRLPSRIFQASARSFGDVSSKARNDGVVPFRKQLKEDLKRRRQLEGETSKSKHEYTSSGRWELTVGIEIHAELNTARKLFSSAATSINDTPNTHVALFDVAFPGTQPHFQKETLIPALRAAIALNCDIQRRSSFDRKHYFYQDQPAGYQITQYYGMDVPAQGTNQNFLNLSIEPYARDGHITLYDHDGIAPEDGTSVQIGIKQIQMEQDTAKTIQQPPLTYLLDFNRVSTPLIEIITLPQIHHPATAAACVKKIQTILKAVDANAVGMEMGGLRADVNVSVRERGSTGQGHHYSGVQGLGQRTEIKNLSSFKAVEDAVIAERDRQIEVLEAGGIIEGETRGWTIGQEGTRKLRGKEGEVDYRYMPDPDLGPDLLDHMKRTLPQLPDESVTMLVEDPRYALTIKDAKTLVDPDDGDRLDYYLDVVDLLRQEYSNHAQDSMAVYSTKVGRTVGNWVLHELGGLLSASSSSFNQDVIPSTELAVIISHLLRKQITGRTAKYLLSAIFHTSSQPSKRRTVEQIISEENLLLRPMTEEDYVALAKQVLDGNEKIIDEIRRGKIGKLKFFVGQMVRRGKEGTVEALGAEKVLREVLGLPPT